MHSDARRTLGALFGGAALTAAGGLGLSLYADRIAREAERLVPQDGRHVRVDGARLHYVDRGSGPAIVMVHGLGGQLRNFSYAMLEPLARDHRVVLIDRPGSGYSTADDGAEPTIAEQGAILGRFIETLGIDRPLLVGHSLGGAVALALALDRPGLVRGLALIAPLTQPQQDVPDAFRGLAAIPASMRRLMAHTIGAPLGRLTAERTVRAVFAPDPAPDDFATRGGGALSQRPGAIAAAAADLASGGRDVAALAARYGTLTLPTAILFGRDDPILSPALHGQRTAAAIPGAQLTVIPGGHMLPITAVDASVAYVAAAAV